MAIGDYLEAGVSSAVIATGAGNIGVNCTVRVKHGSQDVPGNWSWAELSLWADYYCPSGWTFGGSSRPSAGYLDLIIDGTVQATITLPLNNGQGAGRIASGGRNIQIAHNADGSKGITFWARVRQGTDPRNGGYVYRNAESGHVNFYFESIPRTSQVSISNGSIECNGSNNLTIYTNRKSTSFTHTLKYQFGSASGTIATGVGDSYSWTPPKNLLSQIPNSQSDTGTITCTTMNGSQTVGSSTVNFTLTVGSTSNPTLSGASVVEQNSTVTSKAGSSATMALLSTKKVSVTASAKDGASIRSVTVSNNGKSVKMSLSSGKYTGTISSVTSGSYTITVTDSRGLSTSQEVNQTFYNYTYPTIASATFSRTTATGSNGSLTANGKYANMLSNTVTIQVTRTGLSTVTIAGSKTGGSWNFSQSYSDLIYTNSFTAAIKITDSFGQVAQLNVVLARSQPVFWLGKTLAKAAKMVIDNLTCTNLTINGKSFLDRTYPVGSIYMSTVSTSPGTLFGGTWQRIEGRFLLGASATYGAGTQGGEEKHILTVNEMPSHSHQLNVPNGHDFALGGGSYYGYLHQNATTTAVGGGKPHNNMPPYLAVYMWRRTA